MDYFELFETALKVNDEELANRYIKLAIKGLQKKNIKIPREWKIHYCKKCFRKYNSETRVRINNSKITKTCSCGYTRRLILNNTTKE